MATRARGWASKQLSRFGAHVAEPTVRELRKGEGRVDSRLVYDGIAELDRRHGYRAESLSAAELRVFSQNGEDGVLAEIFDRIGAGDRYFVEFGAEDGLEGNTRFLREVLGWRGVYIEADPEKVERLTARVDPQTCTVVRSMVTPQNIESLFEQAGVPEAFDLLSIDIDGQDYYVWQAIERFRPRVVVIEYNAGLAAGPRPGRAAGQGPVGPHRLLRRVDRGADRAGPDEGLPVRARGPGRHQRLLRGRRVRRAVRRHDAAPPGAGLRAARPAPSPGPGRPAVRARSTTPDPAQWSRSRCWMTASGWRRPSR